MSLLDQILSLFTSSGGASSGVRRVTPTEAAQLVKERKAVLVDVREPGEWSRGVAQKAVLLPSSDLMGARRQWQSFLRSLDGREIIMYCHSGARCHTAARVLAAEGFKTANAGSLHAWQRAGLPICKPKHLR